MARRLAASTLIQRSRFPSMFRSGMVLLSAQARPTGPFGSLLGALSLARRTSPAAEPPVSGSYPRSPLALRSRNQAALSGGRKTVLYGGVRRGTPATATGQVPRADARPRDPAGASPTVFLPITSAAGPAAPSSRTTKFVVAAFWIAFAVLLGCSLLAASHREGDALHSGQNTWICQATTLIAVWRCRSRPADRRRAGGLVRCRFRAVEGGLRVCQGLRGEEEGPFGTRRCFPTPPRRSRLTVPSTRRSAAPSCSPTPRRQHHHLQGPHPSLPPPPSPSNAP